MIRFQIIVLTLNSKVLGCKILFRTESERPRVRKRISSEEHSRNVINEQEVNDEADDKPGIFKRVIIRVLERPRIQEEHRSPKVLLGRDDTISSKNPPNSLSQITNLSQREQVAHDLLPDSQRRADSPMAPQFHKYCDKNNNPGYASGNEPNSLLSPNTFLHSWVFQEVYRDMPISIEWEWTDTRSCFVIPQDLWQMPMAFEWDSTNMASLPQDLLQLPTTPDQDRLEVAAGQYHNLKKVMAGRDKDPFLSLSEELAENEHSRGWPSELDFLSGGNDDPGWQDSPMAFDSSFDHMNFSNMGDLSTSSVTINPTTPTTSGRTGRQDSILSAPDEAWTWRTWHPDTQPAGSTSFSDPWKDKVEAFDDLSLKMPSARIENLWRSHNSAIRPTKFVSRRLRQDTSFVIEERGSTVNENG